MKPQQILNKLAKYNEVQKVELSSEEPIKVEFAASFENVAIQTKEAVGAIARIVTAVNELKMAAKTLEDKVDGFMNGGPYTEVVMKQGPELRAKLKELGLQNSAEAKQLEANIQKVSTLRDAIPDNVKQIVRAVRSM